MTDMLWETDAASSSLPHLTSSQETAAAVVEQVRAHVREQGIDPLLQPAEVRRLVDEVVAGLIPDDATVEAARSAFDAIADSSQWRCDSHCVSHSGA